MALPRLIPVDPPVDVQSTAFSVDALGRFQSVFPTVGSINPVLTGLTLTKRLAEQVPI